MTDHVHTIVSDASQFIGQSSPGGIVQWAIRFCQTPEGLPVFCSWVRSIWPDCPYSDGEISEDLISGHNLVGALLGAGLLP